MDGIIVSAARQGERYSPAGQAWVETRARIDSGTLIVSILGDAARPYYDRLIATEEMPVPEPTPRQLKVTKSFQCTPNTARALEEAALREGCPQQRIIARGLANELTRINRNAWTTVDDETAYDPGQYYTYGVDSKGHSAEVRVRIPVPLRAEIQNLIEMGYIPEYRTAQCVMRDAVYHRVKQIAKQIKSGDLERTVDMAMLMSEEMELRARATEAEQLIRVLQENLTVLHAHAVQTDDFIRIREYLATRSDQSGLIPESHRVMYEEVLGEWKKKLKGR